MFPPPSAFPHRGFIFMRLALQSPIPCKSHGIVWNVWLWLSFTPWLPYCLFRLVLADLENCVRTLKPPRHRKLTLVVDNPFPDTKYGIRQAEAIILFNLSALAEIANTKNNLIGVRFHPWRQVGDGGGRICFVSWFAKKRSSDNNNNGKLACPTSAEPKALTKTTLHKRKQQPQQYIHNKHNQLQC